MDVVCQYVHENGGGPVGWVADADDEMREQAEDDSRVVRRIDHLTLAVDAMVISDGWQCYFEKHAVNPLAECGSRKQLLKRIGLAKHRFPSVVIGHWKLGNAASVIGIFEVEAVSSPEQFRKMVWIGYHNIFVVEALDGIPTRRIPEATADHEGSAVLF